MSEFTSSAEKVASIDDILLKIFECLPLRSLTRLKLVSKHWLSLIAGPQFSPFLKPRLATGMFLPPTRLCGVPFSCDLDFLPVNGRDSHITNCQTLTQQDDRTPAGNQGTLQVYVRQKKRKRSTSSSALID